ncbi:MAG: GNAT family N-acetyltransferase [Methanomassiliicoccales archaeon]
MFEIGLEDVKCSIIEVKSEDLCKNSLTPLQHTNSLNLHLSTVRDYKDRFILKYLQTRARVENPGFVFFKYKKEKAKLAWIDNSMSKEPVGYYIFIEPRHEFSKYAHEKVHFPMVLSQLYVCPEYRRRGIATRMIQDFILNCNHDPIWIESPKQETKLLLHKMGYFEPDMPYELWQMMEGLSRWVRADKFCKGSVKKSSEELHVWCGDDFMSLNDLR